MPPVTLFGGSATGSNGNLCPFNRLPTFVTRLNWFAIPSRRADYSDASNYLVSGDGLNTITVPRLSIGLPVYNGEQFLAQTLDSILSQSFTDFEVVVSDNCSTDGTPAICERFAAADPRIRYYRNAANLGAPANYNAAFHRSSGELFKWSSSSDICGPGLLEHCVAALDADPGAVLAFPRTRLFETDICDARDYDDRMNLQQSSPYERFCAVMDNMQLNNVMNGVIRRSVLALTKLHQPFLSSDGILVVELALRGKLVEVGEAFFYRRMSAESTATLRDHDELVKFWAPNESELRFQRWRYLLALLGAVLRARPGIFDTTRGTLSVLRRMVWRRHELLAELTRFRVKPLRHRTP
jgi:glycosyltransferase involved in cell wall biosynthesis